MPLNQHDYNSIPYRLHTSSSAHSDNGWDKGCNVHAAQHKPTSFGLAQRLRAMPSVAPRRTTLLLAARSFCSLPLPGRPKAHRFTPSSLPRCSPAQLSAASQTPAPRTIMVSDGDAVPPFPPLLCPTTHHLPPPRSRGHGGPRSAQEPHRPFGERGSGALRVLGEDGARGPVRAMRAAPRPA